MAFCGKDIAVLQRPISDVVYIHLRAFSGYPAIDNDRPFRVFIDVYS